MDQKKPFLEIIKNLGGYNGFTGDVEVSIKSHLLQHNTDLRTRTFVLPFREEGINNKLTPLLEKLIEEHLPLCTLVPIYTSIDSKDRIGDFSYSLFHGYELVGFLTYLSWNSSPAIQVSTPIRNIEDKFVTIWDSVCKTLVKTKKTQKSIYIVAASNYGGYKLQSLGKLGATYTPENYPTEIQEHREKIIHSLNKSNPIGRLSILAGPPGVGKTYFIRGLVPMCSNTRFIYLPLADLVELTGPKLAPLLLDEVESDEEDEDTKAEKQAQKNICLILEDADTALGHRDGYNSSQVSALLNLASGIPGAAFDLRILATTNIKKIELDPAIIRPGRLLNYLEFRHLTPTEASLSYKTLTGNEKTYTHDVPLSNIYSEADQVEVPTHKMGF